MQYSVSLHPSQHHENWNSNDLTLKLSLPIIAHYIITCKQFHSWVKCSQAYGIVYMTFYILVSKCVVQTVQISTSQAHPVAQISNSMYLECIHTIATCAV